MVIPALWSNWHKRRFTLWSLLGLLIALGALVVVLANLRAMEVSRQHLNQTLALALGQAPLNYVLQRDDFELRKGLTTVAVALSSLFFLSSVVLSFFLARTLQKLHREEKTKSEMLSVITHNANHYLEVITGRLYLLGMQRAEGSDLPHLDQGLELMTENARSLNRLVNSLNDHELLRAGQVRVSRQLLAWRALVERVLRSFAGLMSRDGLQFDFQPGPAEDAVLADPQVAEQVLMNLVHNAVKYSRAGGRITVWTERAGGQLKTCIRDQGPGIAPADWERIFQPFVRLQTNTRGAGLGLANARQFARLLGGAVGVQASELGQGTTFYLSLPAASPPAADGQRSTA